MSARSGMIKREHRRVSSVRRPTGAGDGPNRLELIPTALLIMAALLLGGAANPICDMTIECLALLVIAIMAIRFTPDEWRRSRLGWLMILLALAIGAMELMPLPFAVWRTLPGRQAAAGTLDALSLATGARALSLDPNAAIASLIQCIPGLAAFTAALVASRRTRQAWVTMIIAGACACVLLGALQITGQGRFYLYEKSNFGDVTGLFANHNHAADMLLVGIALLAGRLKAASAGWPGPRLLIAALMMTMAVAVLLTASRFGIVLLLTEIAIIMFWLRDELGRRDWLPVAIVCCICLALAAILLFNPNVGHALDRFNDFSRDLRTEFWAQTLYAARQYWPVGSGLGTFVPVYTTVERLDTLPSHIVNHAHNEYLELILELGLAGVLLIAGYVASFSWCIQRHLRCLSDQDFTATSLGILILLVHSFVEFPLRNESLMVTFGLLNGIVFGATQQESHIEELLSVSK